MTRHGVAPFRGERYSVVLYKRRERMCVMCGLTDFCEMCFPGHSCCPCEPDKMIVATPRRPTQSCDVCGLRHAETPCCACGMSFCARCKRAGYRIGRDCMCDAPGARQRSFQRRVRESRGVVTACGRPCVLCNGTCVKHKGPHLIHHCGRHGLDEIMAELRSAPVDSQQQHCPTCTHALPATGPWLRCTECPARSMR